VSAQNETLKPVQQFARSFLRVVGGSRGAMTLRGGDAAMTFEIDFSRAHQYRWRLLSDEGEVALSGEGYVRKQDCLDVVEALRSGELAAAVVDLTDVPPYLSRRE
jgi:uncharacterized protein YegP (UPF0339 family)